MVKSVEDAVGRSPIDRLELERIYRAESPRLTRYLRKQLRSGQDALDLVHEAFLRLAAASSGVIVQNPGAYLQRVARNLVIDRGRGPDARLAVMHIPIETEPDIPIPATQEQDIEIGDIMRQYRLALAELPARTREIFVLHRVDELTYKEIATRIGIAIPTVQYHIARALVHLDHRLQPAS